MSILKKIFGKVESKSEGTEAYVNREPRVQLHPLYRVGFIRDGEETPIELANISVGGMAVFHRDDPSLQVGASLKGTIRFDKEEFAIEARIRYILGLLAGCQFANAEEQGLPGDEYTRLKRAVENYFRVEILALNLYPVSASFMKPDPRGITHWVTDGRQNEIFGISDGQGLVAFHMSFLNYYVQGERDAGLRAGLMQDKLVTERPAHKASTLLDLSRAPAPETVRLALSFVQNAQRLPADVRKQIEDFLGRELVEMGKAQSG